MADAAELIDHLKDSDAFHLPPPLGKVDIPQPFEALGLHYQILHLTRFKVLELVVAVAMVVVFVWYARRVRGGQRPRGRLCNFLEMMIVFIRTQVARPAIGSHDCDRFVPLLWTMFFFILFLNLLGLAPWTGSATAALSVTGALAIVTFLTVIGAGMVKYGLVRFWLGQVPKMDISLVIGLFVRPLIFFLEVFGLLIRHTILAVRLFANMFAGHVVLMVVLGFLALSSDSLAWWGIMPVSVGGAAALSLLELLVAFIQAYVFTFLAALFIGMAVHQH